MSENRGEMVIYTTPDGSIHTEVRMEAETLWLTQYQLEELFATDRTAIVKHIQNILDTEELEEAATCAKFAQVRQEGKRSVKREIQYYNLDMILSIVSRKQYSRFLPKKSIKAFWRNKNEDRLRTSCASAEEGRVREIESS